MINVNIQAWRIRSHAMVPFIHRGPVHTSMTGSTWRSHLHVKILFTGQGLFSVYIQARGNDQMCEVPFTGARSLRIPNTGAYPVHRYTRVYKCASRSQMHIPFTDFCASRTQVPTPFTCAYPIHMCTPNSQMHTPLTVASQFHIPSTDAVLFTIYS